MEVTQRRLLLALALVFALGIVLSISNAYCAIHMDHVFAPFLYGIALVSLATGGAVAGLFQWRMDRIQLEKVMSILPGDDRKLLRLIIERKSILQNELVPLSGLSKVKVSRIVSRFEQRGIVKKSAYGNTNMIEGRL